MNQYATCPLPAPLTSQLVGGRGKDLAKGNERCHMQNIQWRRVIGASFLAVVLLAVAALFRLIDALLGGAI